MEIARTPKLFLPNLRLSVIAWRLCCNCHFKIKRVKAKNALDDSDNLRDRIIDFCQMLKDAKICLSVIATPCAQTLKQRYDIRRPFPMEKRSKPP